MLTRVNNCDHDLVERPAFAHRVAQPAGRAQESFLGLIAPDLKNPFLAELTARIDVEARRRGYSLIIKTSEGDEQVEHAHLRELERSRVAAILIAPVRGPRSRPAGGSSSRAVYIGGIDVAHGISTVGTDVVRGTEIAVGHLLGHGYERIAIMSGETTDPGRPDETESTWAHMLSQRGADGWIIRASPSREGGWRAMAEEIDAARIPRAIFATSYVQAIGAVRALRERGLRVPDDVAVIGLDGIDDADYCWPPLTAIHAPVDEMAVALIDAAVKDDDSPVARLFEPEIIVRRSCGCEPVD